MGEMACDEMIELKPSEGGEADEEEEEDRRDERSEVETGDEVGRAWQTEPRIGRRRGKRTVVGRTSGGRRRRRM